MCTESPAADTSLGNQRPTLSVSTVMHVSVLCLILAIGVTIAADWGPPVNGLRVSLAVEADTVVVTFENVREDREMFLPLGRAVAVGRAESIHLYLILPDGTRRQLQYTGGSGVAPGRLLPFIVPIMPGSIYSGSIPPGRYPCR